MSIIDRLSSPRGMRGNEGNKEVTQLCLKHPELLKEIAAGLSDKNKKIIADCAEVMTETASENPELVKPFADQLFALLDHKYTRARWEAMHSIALITTLVPDKVLLLLPELEEKVQLDDSVIVRDYAVETIKQLASCGKKEAEKAFPVLLRMIQLHGGKHAARVMEGLCFCLEQHTNYAREIKKAIAPFEDNERGVIKKARKKLQSLLK